MKPVAQHGGTGRRVVAVGGVLLVGISVLLGGLLYRVWQLQHEPDPRVAALMDSQTADAEIAARRGSITDRRGRTLATTRSARRLFVDPTHVESFGTFSEHVGYALGYDPAEVEQILAGRQSRRYVVIDPRLTDARATALTRLALPGLYSEPIVVRDYPQGPLAGQVIGFVGRDGTGLEGMEAQLDGQLRGTGGGYTYLRDHRARKMWLHPKGYLPQRDGETVTLSLDLHLQALAEQELAATVEHFKAASGQLVIMDPNTGELLAMANYPTFDPGAIRQEGEASRRNRIVTDMFEPGSTFKVFVWAGLTELGIAAPTEVFDCEEGAWIMPGGRRLRDASPKGDLTWSEVLKYSSNIGMAKAALRSDHETLHRVVTAFGFGETTGSGLPGELAGLVHPVSRWTSYSTGSVPMGQEVGVTALQIVRAFAVIANGGRLVTPTILPVNRSAADVLDAAPRVISEEVAAATRKVLQDAVETGTGRRAHSAYYALFGKTGTAQLPNAQAGGYHQDRYVSSFIAAAPADAPRLVVACFVQDPDKTVGHYGGLVAGPAVKRVTEQSLLYLGVPTTPGTNPSDLALPAQAWVDP